MQRNLIALALLTMAVVAGFVSWWPEAGPESGPRAQSSSAVAFARPAIAQQQTFLDSVAGIAAWVKTDQTLNLEAIKSALSGVEQDTGDMIVGVVNLSGVPEQGQPHVLAGLRIARVAQIEATADESCFDKPIELPNRPFGAACESGADCKSGLCADPVTPSLVLVSLVCSGCDTDEDCGQGEVCGVGQEAASFLPRTRNCIPLASRPLGSQCLSATECGNGFCNLGVCSECRAASDCQQGESCSKAAHPELIADRVAALCSGKEPGATCAGNGDCDSGICQGGAPVQVCALDGSDCNEDADCPYSSLQINPCVIAGIESGICQ